MAAPRDAIDLAAPAARLKDVARRAGVSIKTVSNVVNRYEHVSATTRARVLAAIAELGYRPNLAARSLRQSRVGVIALEVPSLGIGYFTEFASYVNEAAQRRGYLLLLDHTGGRHASEKRLVHGLRPMLIDGAILNPLSLRRTELDPAQAGVPIVLVGERQFGQLYDHVTIDNVAAAKEATRHLLLHGRRRIAAIGLDGSRRAGDTIRRRWWGFSTAMEEAGLPVRDDWVLPGVDQGRRDGLASVRRLLAPPLRPDAIFCFNDTVAIGALRGLREAGVGVPDEVAVVAVDDIEEGRFSTPSLSTIAPDKAGIARLAVELLIDRINGRRTGPGELFEVGYTLLVRESTAGGTIPV
ncbi:MAG: LacI family DNA-binding transcriptional regulator [Candidatus Dormiibacterota bacterium]